MSHFSVSCILLRWTPARTPLHPDMTTLKCYRVYVNGEVEGMVCTLWVGGWVVPFGDLCTSTLTRVNMTTVCQYAVVVQGWGPLVIVYLL